MPGLMWTLEKEIKLIEHYKAYRFLWDPFDGDYYRKDLRALTFENIQVSLADPKISVNDVKKKIQHLRTSFTREARRKKLFRIYNEPGSEQKPMFSKWIHFQRMLFLKDVIEERGLRLQQEMVYMAHTDDEIEDVDVNDLSSSPNNQLSQHMSPPTALTALSQLLATSPQHPVTCCKVSSSIKEETLSENTQLKSPSAQSPSSFQRRSPALKRSPDQAKLTEICTRRKVLRENIIPTNLYECPLTPPNPEILTPCPAEEHFGHHVSASLSRLSNQQREAAKLAIQQVLFSYSFATSPTLEPSTIYPNTPSSNDEPQHSRDLISAIGQIINLNS